jgi:RNA polymerase sigma factor (sigma-70 family)
MATAAASDQTRTRTSSACPPSGSKADALRRRAAEIRSRQIDFIPNQDFNARKKFVESDLETVRAIEQGLLMAPAGRTSSGLPAHLARMCATPLLTPEEESALFERMNYCKFRADSIRRKMRSANPSVAAINEFDDMIERSERLRNHLLQANTRLVMSIARKFADARNPFDDLLSQGIASLMHSVEKFDFDRGYRFSTYATCAVRRELYRMVMNRKKQARRFSTGTSELLDGHVESEEDQQSPHAKLADYRQLSAAVSEMMEDLDEREQLILSARFGLDDGAKRASYSKLGTRLGISKERVRQLANRAIDKLRELVPDYQLERFLD